MRLVEVCLAVQTSSRLTFLRLIGLAGAEKVFPLGDLSEYEKEGLKLAIPELKGSIDKGVEFGKSG